MDGKTRLFDMSNPHAPKQVYEKVIGRQVNMASSVITSYSIHYTKLYDRRGFYGTTQIALADFGIPFDLGPASRTVELELSVEGIRQ